MSFELNRRSPVRAKRRLRAVGLSAFTAAVVLFVVLNLAAYVTHVIDCINHTFWFLLVFGCLVFPIGVLHGYAVWFGWSL